MPDDAPASNTPSPTCPSCGEALPSSAADGFCPKCLLGEAVAEKSVARDADETVASSGGARSGRATTPSVVASSISATGEGPGDPSTSDAIGPYKILEKIGEGGFGDVFLARQSAPVKREVALKIVKPGMDSREVIARFEAERQALALMDHTNVAQVFDAGTTAEGRPYFVMEYVKGTPITEYCEAHQLTIPERLALFIDVCRAVQHAHQKAIIHRDLKPANVLVAIEDDRAVPKVIDFGVAKALSMELTEKTLFTVDGQMIGTPLYMSPEQAGGGPDIDTRSDIYSLGVLLYELLTGTTPLDPQKVRSAGWAEIERCVREEEPRRPSTRITSPGENANATARTRGMDSIRISRTLRGDLDWIVMKALEKDRARRYETANAFLTDIRRHLDGEPVAASPPSWSYRLGKFARRNKGPLAAAALVFLALIGGVVASTMQANRAREAKENALAVLEFLQEKVLAAARPKDLEGGLGIDTTIREAIDAAEAQIGEAFDDQPLVEASLRTTIGETYRTLGEYEDAVSQNERAFALNEKELGPNHPDTLTAMHKLAFCYFKAGRGEEALALAKKTLEKRTKVLGPEHPDTLSSTGVLSIGYYSVGRYEEALALSEKTHALRTKVSGPEHRDTIKSMSNLASSYHNMGRHKEALALGKAALELTAKVTGLEHPARIADMHNVAIYHTNVGQDEEALALRQKALELSTKVMGPEHPQTLSAMAALAHSYARLNRHEDALTLREKTLELSETALGPEHPHALHAMASLASSYSDVGRDKEALALGERTLQLTTKVRGAEHVDTTYAIHRLAIYDIEVGRFAEAEQRFRKVLVHYKNHLPEGKDWAYYDAQSRLGEVLFKQAKFDDAEPQLLEGCVGLRKTAPAGRKKPVKESLTRLVDLYEAWGKPEEAARWKAELETVDAESP